MRLNAITFPHRQRLLWTPVAGKECTQVGTGSITKGLLAHCPYVTAMLESLYTVRGGNEDSLSPVDVVEAGLLCVQGVQPPPKQPARNQD